ncbi:MAG TPA: S41 family peptidase [Stellaceae bacterium]|nr:S41 family peptidase [Stellaceae bacterium]
MKRLSPFVIAVLMLAACDQDSSAPSSKEKVAKEKETLDPALMAEIYNQIHDRYYMPPANDKELVEGAIKGMMATLDPHSSYMNAKEYGDLLVQTQGKFGGLGLQVIMENSAVKVISPIDDTPAARSGIKPGDLILAIDGVPVAEMSLNEAVEKLRGEIGTSVKIIVRRKGADPFELTLTRAEIKVEPVKWHMEGESIGYVRITNFSERTGAAMETALNAIKTEAKDKLAGIILDLRNNPGGLLDQAIAVSNDFLDGGAIVSTRGRRPGDDRQVNAEADHDQLRGMPIVVLINGGSASASEIVAGALHDNHRAVLLGTRSFGKGSVQTVLPVKESGGAMRLTTALYYTPSGRSIQAMGIEPDLVVEPAKIEPLTAAGGVHEADLRGALKNPDAAPNLGQNAGGNGGDEDYQLLRAVDVLKGLSIFKKYAAN